MNFRNIKKVVLGEKIGLEDFMAVARGKAEVEFSPAYSARVKKSRALIEKAISEDRVMYGVTTGFGSLSTKTITQEETEQLQENIVMSHSVSVGQPLCEEQVRGTMLMVLQSLGLGVSGVRLETLELIRQMLNVGVVPWIPREGSVGYLAPEGQMAMVFIGRGKAYWKGELMAGGDALSKAGLKPIVLGAKEGLALISGTTAVTALGAIALYDMLQAAVSADIIGSISLEALRGVLRAFDERVMSVHPHDDQVNTAANVRRILSDSGVLEHYKGTRLQDALSLRCIPQLHGAAKKLLYDAKKTFEVEMNACGDNPIVWDENGEPDIISACNCDSAYVGSAMDTAAIAATMLAKMSERRNNRFIDESLSGYPAYLVKNPGLNSGLMIPQYSQCGMLSDMRILCTPATADNVPTCGNQEDYVAMGYNASKKAGPVSEYLEYILAIELLSGYQAQKFIDSNLKRSTATGKVLGKIAEKVPDMEQDMQLYPYIEYLRDLIHSGEIVRIAEECVGELH